MSEHHVALGFLFARLSHPEGMVRERACMAIAQLLNTEDTSEPTRKELASWMERQQLESLAVLALLVWIRATIDNPAIQLPDAADVVKSFPRPSFLSWLLLRELYGRHFPEPEWGRAFSDGLYRDFEPDPFFFRHAVHFVARKCIETANRIDSRTQFPFVPQWAWEWSGLVKKMAVVPDARVLRSRGNIESEPYAVCYDFRLSEIFKSAYLRTLAWAMFNGIIDRGDAARFAAQCCPIDVGLWRVVPSRCPHWWPRVSEPGDTIDGSVGQVMQGLNDLYHEQTQSRDEWSLVQASGLIAGKNVHIELEIYGVFQRCLGPHEPEAQEVVQGFRWKVTEPLIFDSPIKLSGRLIPWPDSSSMEKKGDWEIVPAFTRVDAPVAGPWQWWRRQVWAPALCLVDGHLDISATTDGISYDHESSIVGRWTDWSWALRDRRDANLPPATGQALFVKRDLVEAFSHGNGYAFCWFWRVTGYHRKWDSGKYETVTFEGELGATRICIA